MAIKHTHEMPALLDKGSWKRLFENVMKKAEAGELDVSKPFRFYLTDTKVRRSLPQNRYYWGVVLTTFADACGYETEDVHEIFKRRFAGYTMKTFPGSKGRIKVPNSTSGMNKEEFGKYLDKVIQFCAEQGVPIAHPEALTDEQNIHLVSENLIKP